MSPHPPAQDLPEAEPPAVASAGGGLAPLTPEEALALLRAALGEDEPRGLLLAVSGGPDSIAMMGLAAAAPGLPPLAVASVDHGLRAASRQETALVAAFAANLGLAHSTLFWEGPHARFSQESAREARYALLEAQARALGATHLVTAHSLDDQAETVLIRLAAGSGPAGLGAMRANVARGAIRHIRPFLCVAKARLVATCAAMNWPYVQDPSNSDPRFARSRIRALMPLLAREGLSAKRLAMLAARLRRAEEALEQIAQRSLASAVLPCAPPEAAIRLDAAAFQAEPLDLALRMLRQAMLALATPAPREAVEAAKIPLAKLERLLADLRGAIAEQRPFRRSLAQVLIAFIPAAQAPAALAGGGIELRPAPPRRRQGTKKAPAC